MTNFISDLRQILPANAIIEAAAERAAFETDWRRLHAHPAVCVVSPADTAQVAAVVRLCANAGIGLVPQGGNTGLVAGAVPVPNRPQIILSLRRMNRILQLDERGGTITVEAGVTVQAVQNAAAGAKRMFPISFGAEGSAQIGGIISTNAGGMQVLSYGATRAQVLGLEVVLADGEIWNGLRALRKDNTGFDLKQLFIGAEGSLGIITAAVLLLRPAVSGRAMALAGVASVAAALALFGLLRGRAGAALTLCEYIGRPAMDLAVAQSPGGRLPCDAACYVLAEISAQGDETAQALLESILEAALEQGFAGDAVIAQSERERADLLRLREAIPEGELAEGGAVKHDISVPINKIPETLDAIGALVAEKFPDCRLNIFGHIGDGNLHVNVRPPVGKTLADLQDRYEAITAAVEAVAVARGGSFSAEHGIGQIRLAGMAAHKSPIELSLMRALKTALDPHNIMNPGKTLPPAL